MKTITLSDYCTHTIVAVEQNGTTTRKVYMYAFMCVELFHVELYSVSLKVNKTHSGHIKTTQGCLMKPVSMVGVSLSLQDIQLLGHYGWASGWGALEPGSRLRPKTLQVNNLEIIITFNTVHIREFD